MIKIKPKIYAQALWQACQETDNLDQTILGFSRLLIKHNKKSQLTEIIKEFNKLANQQEQAIDVKVESANPLSEDSKNKITALVKELKKIKKVYLQETVLPAVIGGVKISTSDTQLDGTIKRKLQLIKNNLINN